MVLDLSFQIYVDVDITHPIDLAHLLEALDEPLGINWRKSGMSAAIRNHNMLEISINHLSYTDKQEEDADWVHYRFLITVISLLPEPTESDQERQISIAKQLLGYLGQMTDRLYCVADFSVEILSNHERTWG